MTYSALSARFGENLRLLRARAHISQEELGFRADVHRTQVSLLESGSRLPRLDTVLKLAGGLEVEARVLLDGITYRPRFFSATPGEFEVSSRGLFDETHGGGKAPAEGADR